MRDLRWRDVSETIKCDDFGGSLLSSVGPVGIRASNAMAVSSRTFWKVSQELRFESVWLRPDNIVDGNDWGSGGCLRKGCKSLIKAQSVCAEPQQDRSVVIDPVDLDKPSISPDCVVRLDRWTMLAASDRELLASPWSMVLLHGNVGGRS